MVIVKMCRVLHNLSVIWEDIMPRDMYEEVPEPGRPPGPPPDPIVDDDLVIDYNILPR